MSDRERVRRPEPARTEPVRNMSGLFRDGGSGDGASRDRPPGLWSWLGDDPVTRAVRAGYEVAERAMRSGYGYSDDADRAAPAPWGMPLPMAMAQPWLEMLAATAGQWIEFLTSMTSMTPVAPPRPPGNGAAHPTPAAGLRVSVELRSARPASVQLDLPALPAGASLVSHGLHAPPALAAPPITDVAIAIAPDGRATIQVAVPDGAPAGLYAGVVVDAADGRVLGTLTVRVA